MLHGIVYRSEAKLPEADVSNLDILRGALVANRALLLTGYLHRDAGRLLQAAERPRRAVITMMERLSRDPGHRSLVVLEDGSLRGRRFGGWSMDCAGARALRGTADVLEMRGLDAAAFLLELARRESAVLWFREAAEHR